MVDYIDRQAAIEALAAVCDRVCQYTKKKKKKSIMHGACPLGSAFDAIRELPSAQPEQRWIPVSEELPKEDTDVMIAYRYKAGEGDTSHCDIDITSYGQAYFGGRACSFKEWRAPFEYFHTNYEVVAWMPLPEPYKEKENE